MKLRLIPKLRLPSRDDARFGEAVTAVSSQLRTLNHSVLTVDMDRQTEGRDVSTPQARADAVTEAVLDGLPPHVAQYLRGACAADAHHEVFSINMSAARLALPDKVKEYIRSGMPTPCSLAVR